jgi:hypothetical protein
LERETGANVLRSAIEEVLEGILFEVEAGMRYVITQQTVRGGEPIEQSMSKPNAPLSAHLFADARRKSFLEMIHNALLNALSDTGALRSRSSEDTDC